MIKCSPQVPRCNPLGGNFMDLNLNSVLEAQKPSKKKAYYELLPGAILKDIDQLSEQPRMVEIKELKMICCPHVYPSDQFRTTNFLLDAIHPFLKDSRVCDMGCGPGIVGLYAASQGAKKIVQADINHFAVKNAEKNKEYHKIPDQKMEIYLSNCFDSVPSQKFDTIVFNLPFHSDPIEINNPLQHAFFDPCFQTVKKFLNQVSEFSTKRTSRIFLAFSNKGDTQALENLFEDSIFNWKLWKITNQNQQFDNRIYLLRNI